jgi:hypothetical protein
MATRLNIRGDISPIRAALARWGLRLRLNQTLRWLPIGLAGGLGAAALLALAARLWPILAQADVLRLSALAAGIGLLAAAAIVLLWRRTPLELAQQFDVLLGLKERLSTAVEIDEGGLPVESMALAEAQRADAVAALKQANARRALPLRIDWRDWAVAGIVAGLLALAIFLPNPQEEVLAEQVAVEAAIAEEIQQLEDLRDQALEDPALTDAERVEVVEELEELIETLSQDGLSQEEAMAALDATEQELRDLSEQFAAERQAALEEASAQLPSDVGEAIQEGDFAAAGEALQQMLEEGMTPEELADLADQLEAAAEALEESNPELAEALRDAAEAIRAGDIAAAQEALQEAAEQMAAAGEPTVAQVDEMADAAQAGEGAVAQAGEGSQPGEGGMGQAQPGQAGEGGEEGEGETAGGHSAGRGESDEAAEGGPAGTDVGTNEPGDGGEAPIDELYAPQRIGGEGGEDLDMPIDPETGLPVQEGQFTDNPTGAASVPYTQVWGDYAGAVNEALESGYVPLGMRGIIQQYFSRLAP